MYKPNYKIDFERSFYMNNGSKNTLIIVLAVLVIGLAGALFYFLYPGQVEDIPEEIVPNGNDVVNDLPVPPAPPEEETMIVIVFFNQLGEEECDAVFPARREIPETEAVGRAALEELLRGPTAEEEMQGYFTSIPEGTTLIDLEIANGVATANFSEEMDTAAGSCTVIAIRAQIEQTLMQFATVENVVIAVEGETEGVLQP